MLMIDDDDINDDDDDDDDVDWTALAKNHYTWLN